MDTRSSLEQAESCVLSAVSCQLAQGLRSDWAQAPICRGE